MSWRKEALSGDWMEIDRIIRSRIDANKKDVDFLYLAVKVVEQVMQETEPELKWHLLDAGGQQLFVRNVMEAIRDRINASVPGARVTVPSLVRFFARRRGIDLGAAFDYPVVKWLREVGGGREKTDLWGMDAQIVLSPDDPKIFRARFQDPWPETPGGPFQWAWSLLTLGQELPGMYPKLWERPAEIQQSLIAKLNSLLAEDSLALFVPGRQVPEDLPKMLRDAGLQVRWDSGVVPLGLTRLDILYASKSPLDAVFRKIAAESAGAEERKYLSDDLGKSSQMREQALTGKITPETLLDEILGPIFRQPVYSAVPGLIATGDYSYHASFLTAAEVSEEQFPVLAVSEKLIQLSTPEENRRSLARKLVGAFSERSFGYPLPQFGSLLEPVASMDALAWAAAYYEIIRVATGELDPFKEVKKQANEDALAFLPSLEQEIASAPDPLLAAIEVGIIGNALDKGVTPHPDFEGVLSALRQQVQEAVRRGQSWFTRADYGALLKQLDLPEQQILFVMDNAGEAVLDLLFIKRLLDRGHRVTLVGRGRPAVNDVTKKDIEELLDRKEVGQYFQGIENWRSRISVVSSGSDLAGTNLRQATSEFRQAWLASNIRIAKGQGNWETLGGPNALTRDVFHILLVKEPRMIRGAFPRGAKVLLYRPAVDFGKQDLSQWLSEQLAESSSLETIVDDLAKMLNRTGPEFSFWRLAFQSRLEREVEGVLGRENFRKKLTALPPHPLKIQNLLENNRPIELDAIENSLRRLGALRFRKIRWFKEASRPNDGIPSLAWDVREVFSAEQFMQRLERIGVGGSFVNGFLTRDSDIDLIFSFRDRPELVFHLSFIREREDFPDTEGFVTDEGESHSQTESILRLSADQLLVLENDGLRVKTERLAELFRQNHEIRSRLRGEARATGTPLTERVIAHRAAEDQQAALDHITAGAEEKTRIASIETRPSLLAERMGGLARVWDGYTSDAGKMAGDDLLPALVPGRTTIEFPASVPSVKMAEGLTLWVDSSLAGAIPAREWGLTVRLVDPSERERVIREEIPKGGIILLDQARYAPELHRGLKSLLESAGRQGLWISAEEIGRMDASELAMTLEILRRSGLPLPSAGMEQNLDGDLHRFLYA